MDLLITNQLLYQLSYAGGDDGDPLPERVPEETGLADSVPRSASQAKGHVFGLPGLGFLPGAWGFTDTHRRFADCVSQVVMMGRGIRMAVAFNDQSPSWSRARASRRFLNSAHWG